MRKWYPFLMVVPVFASVPQIGLVGEFLFHKGASDQSIIGNNGIVHGALPTADRFGKDSSAYLFNGTSSYIEIPDDDAYSIATTGTLSISAWIRPDTLDFPITESENYVHWMGKGISGQHEWVFRMYNLNSSRPNRISCYAFNLAGGLGSGSYVQEPVIQGNWIHLVATYNYPANQIRIYKNGMQKDQDFFTDYSIVPANGTAPLRIGTRDFSSFFRGAIDDLRIYNRILNDDEIDALYQESNPSSARFSKPKKGVERPSNGDRIYSVDGKPLSGQATPTFHVSKLNQDNEAIEFGQLHGK